MFTFWRKLRKIKAKYDDNLDEFSELCRICLEIFFLNPTSYLLLKVDVPVKYSLQVADDFV